MHRRVEKFPGVETDSSKSIAVELRPSLKPSEDVERLVAASVLKDVGPAYLLRLTELHRGDKVGALRTYMHDEVRLRLRFPDAIGGTVNEGDYTRVFDMVFYQDAEKNIMNGDDVKIIDETLRLEGRKPQAEKRIPVMEEMAEVYYASRDILFPSNPSRK